MGRKERKEKANVLVVEIYSEGKRGECPGCDLDV